MEPWWVKHLQEKGERGSGKQCRGRGEDGGEAAAAASQEHQRVPAEPASSWWRSERGERENKGE
jgi:hypothetical protein